MHRHHLLVLVSLASVACSTRKMASVGGVCAATSDCVSGAFCVSGICAMGKVTNNNNNNTSGSKGNNTGGGSAPTVTSVVSNADGTLTFQGTNLSGATRVTVSGGAYASAVPMSLIDASSTALSVAASATQAINFVADTTYSFIVSTAAAAASAPFPVTFSAAPSSITMNMLAGDGCASGQTLFSSGSGVACTNPRRTIQIPLTAVAYQSGFQGVAFGFDVFNQGPAYFSFTLPVDYAPGDTTVDVLTSLAAPEGCALNLTLGGMYYRSGVAQDEGFNLSPVSVTYAAISKPVATSFALPSSSNFSSHQPGDAAIFTLSTGNPPAGTACAQLSLFSVSVTYSSTN